jgi:GT2 family glycosyltransferase
MTHKPIVSIIIVSYNVSGILREALRSIVGETLVEYEIIVVDNNSSDDSCAMIEAEFPAAVLVRNAENVGFARANNQGLALARGEYVLFLNPDTIILDGAIDRMLEFLASRPDIGVLGPRTFNADGVSVQATVLRRPTLLRAFHANIPLWRLALVWRPPLLGEYAPPASGEVEIVKGSCMLISAALAREIGGMNEQYFMYSEEIDLCEAVAARGLAVYYYTDASIIHLGGASTDAVSEAMAVQLYRSLKQVFARRYRESAFALGVLRWILVAGSLWRAVAWGVTTLLPNLSAERAAKARKRFHAHRALLRWLVKEYA